MKCTICLSLVEALYPSELELPVISGLVQVSPITIEMEYKIKCLKFILFFSNGCQKLTSKGLNSNQEGGAIV